MSIELANYIHAVPDFPKPGILFRDISPLLSSPEAFSFAIEVMARHVEALGVSGLVAIESRGFLFGAPLAMRTKIPLVLVRKRGKLPGERESVEYGLEYGVDRLEIKKGVLPERSRVVVVDDVLATGGTAAATGELVTKVGGVVAGYIFLIELAALGGRGKLEGVLVESVVRF